MPIGLAHRMLVSVTNCVPWQAVTPICTDVEKSCMPKLFPSKVTTAPPETGLFGCDRTVTTELSYVNTGTLDPVWPPIVTVTPRLEPDPAGTTHPSEVIDVHVLVAHIVRPITAVGEMSANPKLVPSMARVALPLVGALVPLEAVIIGDAYVYAFARVPDADARVRTMLRAWPDPIGEVQRAAVADVHDVVPQEVKPNRSDGDKSARPKLRPATDTPASPTLGALV